MKRTVYRPWIDVLPLSTVAIALFAIVLCTVAYPYTGGGYNQASRLDLLRSMVLDNTLTIDKYHGNTGDKSLFNGHYYSDKAPGTALLALPAYGASLWVVEWLGMNSLADWGEVISTWITTTGSVGLLTATGAVCMFLLLSGGYVSRRTAFLAVLFGFLGSLPFSYATALYSHSGTIGLLCISLYAAERCKHAKRTSSWQTYALLLGCAAGFAVISEYTCGIAAAAIVLYAWRHKPWSVLLTCLGGALPVLLLLLYNTKCYGSPLAFGYSHVEGWEGMKQGLFGVTFAPNFSAVTTLLFSTGRGLFYWTPLFLLAFPGVFLLWNKNRLLTVLTVVTIVLHVLSISSYSYWDGGYALGPRHFAAILPFFVLLSAMGMQVFRKLGVFLGLLSVVLTGTATLTEISFPNMEHPIIYFYWPRLLTGDIKFNLGRALGLDWLTSMWLPLALLILTVFLSYLPWPQRIVDTTKTTPQKKSTAKKNAPAAGKTKVATKPKPPAKKTPPRRKRTLR